MWASTARYSSEELLANYRFKVKWWLAAPQRNGGNRGNLRHTYKNIVLNVSLQNLFNWA